MATAHFHHCQRAQFPSAETRQAKSHFHEPSGSAIVPGIDANGAGVDFDEGHSPHGLHFDPSQLFGFAGRF
jgi:hypothetical protein